MLTQSEIKDLLTIVRIEYLPITAISCILSKDLASRRHKDLPPTIFYFRVQHWSQIKRIYFKNIELSNTQSRELKSCTIDLQLGILRVRPTIRDSGCNKYPWWKLRRSQSARTSQSIPYYRGKWRDCPKRRFVVSSKCSRQHSCAPGS